MAEKVDWIIFTTGIGVTTLMECASEAGMEEDFLAKIKSASVAARGYKRVAALKKLGVTVDIRSDEGRTAMLKEQLQKVDFFRKSVIVQLYGTSQRT